MQILTPPPSATGQSTCLNNPAAAGTLGRAGRAVGASEAALQFALQVLGLQSAHAGPFSLSVAAGECLVVRGPSGAGKSLLLRMIADLDENTGDALLYGQSRAAMSAPAWRRQVIYQAAEPAWWEPTAADHFAPEQQDSVVALLPRLGLNPTLLATEITRLSTGERQRMALLRSLAMRPRVLLLDEPTAALDGDSIQLVEVLLREQLADGLALVLVTHSEEQAERLADRRMQIAGGKEVL